MNENLRRQIKDKRQQKRQLNRQQQRQLNRQQDHHRGKQDHRSQQQSSITGKGANVKKQWTPPSPPQNNSQRRKTDFGPQDTHTSHNNRYGV